VAAAPRGPGPGRRGRGPAVPVEVADGQTLGAEAVRLDDTELELGAEGAVGLLGEDMDELLIAAEGEDVFPSVAVHVGDPEGATRYAASYATGGRSTPLSPWASTSTVSLAVQVTTASRRPSPVTSPTARAQSVDGVAAWLAVRTEPPAPKLETDTSPQESGQPRATTSSRPSPSMSATSISAALVPVTVMVWNWRAPRLCSSRTPAVVLTAMSRRPSPSMSPIPTCSASTTGSRAGAESWPSPW
jgi:hypothetical protein